MNIIIHTFTWKDKTESPQVLGAKLWSKTQEIKSKDTHQDAHQKQGYSATFRQSLVLQ